MSGLIDRVKRFVDGKPEALPPQTRGVQMIDAKIATLQHIMEVAKTANPPDTETIKYVKDRLYSYRAAKQELEYYARSRGGGRGDRSDT